MTLRAAGRLLLFATLVSGCGGAAPVRPSEPALVAVQILRGDAPAAPSATRLALVIAATASMGAPAVPGVTKLAAAQTRAIEILRTAPASTRISIAAVGLADGPGCGAPGLVSVSGPADDTDALSAAVGALAPGDEGSLAVALQTLAGRLSAEGAADGARVVAFGDLEDTCGGDLCAAVETLVAAGASLDLVVLGEHPTPACVATAGMGGNGPTAPAIAPTRFRVLPATGAAVVGISGGKPVSAPAGPARIEIGLDPLLEVGPITLAPGALVRVRVLDFPAARPPVREWSLEVLGTGGDLAASAAPPSP